MIIKKHQSGNEYVRAGDLWVRNFTKSNVSSVLLDKLHTPEEYAELLSNEQANLNYPSIAEEKIGFSKVVIVSDGYKFSEKYRFLTRLGPEVKILAVNKALRKWQLMTLSDIPELRRPINAFIANNPFKECLGYLPSRENKYFPACIASTRTHHKFLKNYAGDVYTYTPSRDQSFGLEHKAAYYIDDYRNVICAAIGLAYRFGAEKILLLCCDDSFEDQRETAVQLPNGLWTYPQQMRAQEIIDANLFWLSKEEMRPIRVASYSSGIEYQHAAYISNAEEAINFFKD